MIILNYNYDKLLIEEINKVVLLDKKPRLLLHSCCAPCSSYVIDYLSKYFYITVSNCCIDNSDYTKSDIINCGFLFEYTKKHQDVFKEEVAIRKKSCC